VSEPLTPEDFLAPTALGLAAYAWLVGVLAEAGVEVEVRTTKSQVAFRRRRGFAFLWRPRMYQPSNPAEVVLSVATGEPIRSDRFKEVVQPRASVWMHHLELHSPDDLDEEVAGWLLQAADEAAPA
jgi:hypothetical protein